jgi:hypothetical protein
MPQKRCIKDGYELRKFGREYEEAKEQLESLKRQLREGMRNAVRFRQLVKKFEEGGR